MRKVLISILLVMTVFGALLVTACEKKVEIAPEDQKSWNDVFARMQAFREEITEIASPKDSPENR